MTLYKDKHGRLFCVDSHPDPAEETCSRDIRPLRAIMRDSTAKVRAGEWWWHQWLGVMLLFGTLSLLSLILTPFARRP